MQIYIKQLASRILFTMSDKHEAIANASNFLFQLMHTNYGPDILIPSFIDCLEQGNLIRIKAGALEVLNMLIKEAKKYFEVKENVKTCTKKTAQLINDNFSNKKIVLPALGVLLALRDKSYDISISTILSLPEPQLTKIKALASEYASDLDENIASFEVSQCEPVVEIKKLKPRVKKKENNTDKNIVHRTPSKVQVEEEIKVHPIKKADRNIMIKVIDKGISNKYSTPISKPKTELEQLNELLVIDKSYTENEVNLILDLLAKVIEINNEKVYWKKMMLKTLRFLFLNTIFTTNEHIQMRGLQILERLVYSHIELLSPHLNELLESIARAYTLPKKAWETLTNINEYIADKYSRKEIIPSLIEMAVNTEPPLLQAFIRCIAAVVNTGGSCDSFIDELINFLYVVSLFNNIDDKA